MKFGVPYQRMATVAGSFYPESAGQLRQLVSQCLASQSDNQHSDQDAPKALIVPHAGLEFSGGIAAAGYVQLRPVANKIKRVVLIGPGRHKQLNAEIAISSANSFVTPLGEVPVDISSITLLNDHFSFVGVDDDIHDSEYSLEMQLPFLQLVLEDFVIVPLIIGNVEYDHLVECLSFLWGGAETLIIVSSHLSLNQEYTTARGLDQFVSDAIMQLQPNGITNMHTYGEAAIKSLLFLSKFAKLRVKVLDVRNSGDTSGVKDSVVGYGCYGFYPQKNRFSSQLRQQLKGMARMSIEYGLRTGKAWQPHLEGYQKLLTNPGACFVTLFDSDGNRRGSAGNIETDVPLLEYVCESAYCAAFEDPLFTPLSLKEWSNIYLDIAVVDKVELLLGDTEKEMVDQLYPYVDGVVLKKDDKGTGFLPVDWYEFPDRNEYFNQLKKRAGMEDNQWDASYEVIRYTTESW